MEDKKIVVSKAHVDKLLARGDAEAAMLYLHIAMHGGFSLTKACGELGRTQAQVNAAADTLRALGLLKSGQPLKNEELPQYTAADIVVRSETDSAFEGLVEETQKCLGKLLSTNDLRILFGIYDHLGLPVDVIFLLINHCIENYRTLHGEGRMPTMRFIEKEAWYWAGQEIMTYEAAEEHIRREKERKSLVFRTAETLQIRGRELSPSERKYIESWLEKGFMPEALAEAYDRTVLGTGKLTWRYMDKILCSWHEKGLHTVQEIQSGDGRGMKKGGDSAPAKTDDDELAELRRLHAYLMNKEK